MFIEFNITSIELFFLYKLNTHTYTHTHTYKQTKAGIHSLKSGGFLLRNRRRRRSQVQLLDGVGRRVGTLP